MAIRTYIDLYILWRRDYSIIFVFVAVEKAAAVYHFFASFFLRLFSGFPCGSAGKESTCNTGDLGLIPGLERSSEEGMAPTPVLAWRIPMDRRAWQDTVCGIAKSWT